MRDLSRRLALATLLAILAPALRAAEPPRAADAATAARSVRVFAFETLPLRDAQTLVRRELRIASAAAIDRGSRLVVGDVVEQVDRAEALLRERDPGLRASEPHPPLDLERLDAVPVARRDVLLVPDSTAIALVVARGVYAIRDARPFSEGEGVGLRAAPEVLDAIEALYRELGLVREPAEASE